MQHFYKKEYVNVLAAFYTSGKVIPKVIKFDDGSRYKIDRVLDIRPAASLKVGGAGIRYTISVNGKQTHLFREEERWFVVFDLPETG